MTTMKNVRKERVKKFQEACVKSGFRELAPYIFEKHGGFSTTLSLCTLIHGNEIGGIEVFLQLLGEDIQPKSNLRIMLGNVEAYYEDKRFLETDMNRSFGLREHKTAEEVRARELEKYFKDSDVLIDIHQTIGPTSTPFYIFESDERSCNLARFLHPTLPIVTNAMKRDFNGVTSTAFTTSNGGMAVTIETGQKSVDETQISLALEISRKAIQTDFTKTIPEFPLTSTYTFSQIISNPDGSLEMVRRFSNFDQVKKGELLAKNTEKEIRAEADGVILFPKYGDYAKASKELALILIPVS